MALTVTCSQCGQAYSVAPHMAGQQAQCSCGAVINVPAQPAAPRPQQPAAPQQPRPPAPQQPRPQQPQQPRPQFPQQPAPMQPPGFGSPSPMMGPGSSFGAPSPMMGPSSGFGAPSTGFNASPYGHPTQTNVRDILGIVFSVLGIVYFLYACYVFGRPAFYFVRGVLNSMFGSSEMGSFHIFSCLTSILILLLALMSVLLLSASIIMLIESIQSVSAGRSQLKWVNKLNAVGCIAYCALELLLVVTSALLLLELTSNFPGASVGQPIMRSVMYAVLRCIVPTGLVVICFMRVPSKKRRR